MKNALYVFIIAMMASCGLSDLEKQNQKILSEIFSWVIRTYRKILASISFSGKGLLGIRCF